MFSRCYLCDECGYPVDEDQTVADNPLHLCEPCDFEFQMGLDRDCEWANTTVW